MAYKLIAGWLKALWPGRRVTANHGSVAIGADNNAPINILNVSRTPPLEVLNDLDGYLNRQSRRQLDHEKHSGKYIPDVFIETRTTKNLARTFTHPLLFFRRTLNETRRIRIPSVNRFLAKAGLPSLPYPDVASYDANYTLATVGDAARRLSAALEETVSAVERFRKISPSAPSPFPIKPGCEAFYAENVYQMQGFGWGVVTEITERQDELLATRARVFILVGRAGQGKTNFVCDFVENFLFKHGIPCAYLTGRRISAVHAQDLGDTIPRLIFPDATFTFPDAAKILSTHAATLNKPFVLIIDGLNEHRRIGDFSAQLESFIEGVLDYPNIKLLLTCRSEFFEQRFGNLLNCSFSSQILVHKSHEKRRDEERYDDLLAAYFAFFQVQPDRVARQVIQSLGGDILLLRFFCEAYGARGKPSGYRQSNITNIYREEIFKIYLEKKLGAADVFMQRGSDKLAPQGELPNLIAVLEHAVEYMFKKETFSDVPISAIPEKLHEALYGLLDEELVLRRDASAEKSIFSASEETINFTFDEFRDYLLAQYLVDRVFARDQSELQRYIDRSDPVESEAIEGTKRFLFYASRGENNAWFFDFFCRQPWYSDVYHHEIFNIDTRMLRPDDRERVLEILRTGGDAARSVARSLAVRWKQSDNELLNLSLLVSYIGQIDEAEFDSLVVGTFRSAPHSNYGASATGLCNFIATKLLPGFEAKGAAPESPLFQFLILLLPVDGGANLQNECVETYRHLLQQHPAYGIELLVKSLNYRTHRHKPYVWHLLAEFAEHIPGDLRRAIEALVSDSDIPDNPMLRIEMTRFIDRFRLDHADR